MSRIITIFTVIMLISGCASVFTRLEKYKEQNQNTILVKTPCTVTSTKNIVRQVIKESNLFVERPQLEKDNFIFANTGCGNYWKNASINLIGIPQATYTRLGFFFAYNEESKVTTITIAEESAKVSLLSTSKTYRNELADKIRIRALELEKK